VAVVTAAYVHWRVVLVLLEWRDASGGCAVPVTSGPLHSVLDHMKEMGHELLPLDQVGQLLCGVWDAFVYGIVCVCLSVLVCVCSVYGCVRMQHTHTHTHTNTHTHQLP
jgi:hypothetical protein